MKHRFEKANFASVYSFMISRPNYGLTMYLALSAQRCISFGYQLAANEA